MLSAKQVVLYCVSHFISLNTKLYLFTLFHSHTNPNSNKYLSKIAITFIPYNHYNNNSTYYDISEPHLQAYTAGEHKETENAKLGYASRQVMV